MQPITYRLDTDAPAAARYYPAAAAFTDKVLARARHSITPLACSYHDFIAEYGLEDTRSVEEYTFELLNLGVLWRRYGSLSLSVEMAPFHLLAFLSEWRKKHQRLKPVVDLLRGILMSFFLAPREPERTETVPCCLADIERLVRWLEATGDLREDAIRFVRWLAYWASLSSAEFGAWMERVMQFSDWFEEQARSEMGMFTPNVDAFVEHNASRYRWREDRFACLRSRVEYHLNMVGAEIMNRAFRTDFLRCDRTTVLVPGCLRLRAADDCEGVKSSDGIRCSGCEPGCRVHQLRVLGMERDFDVVVIPHSSDLSLWAPRPGEPVTGVVASACLSVLVQGGWELRRYGVPAQCVLLNECGCKKHWHREGFPTRLDIRELKRILTPVQEEQTCPSTNRDHRAVSACQT